MPKAKLSPSKNIVQACSNPDISGISIDDELANITSRTRRHKTDSSKNEFQIFKEEVRDMLAGWKKEQDASLAILIADMAAIKEQNTEIQKSNREIEKSLEFMNSNYEDMKSRVENLAKDRSSLLQHISNLERQISDLRSSSRSSTVELRNVPVQENCSLNDITTVVMDTCKVLEIAVQANDLRDIYRIPNKNDTSKSTIIAEFKSVSHSQNILQAVKNFNKSRRPREKRNTEHNGIPGKATPIYISERLPPSIRKLYYDARQFASSHEYKYCWFANNNIFLKKEEGAKVINIEMSQCLENLRINK